MQRAPSGLFGVEDGNCSLHVGAPAHLPLCAGDWLTAKCVAPVDQGWASSWEVVNQREPMGGGILNGV